MRKDAGAGSLRDDRVPEAPVSGDDTIRVMHVPKRFFIFFMILVTFNLAPRIQQKGFEK